MFRSVFERVWAFDAEWIPDPISGRMLYRLPAEMPDNDVIEEMWKLHATETDPTPFLKTAMCRMVSLVVLERYQRDAVDVRLRLHSFPEDTTKPEQCAESNIIRSFLAGVGKYKPQLVGFNSFNSDLKILVQRGVATGITAKEFSSRPAKPWEGNDYFAKGQECNVDLYELFGSFGRTSTVSLNEMAVVCGIPGKLGTSGNDVAGLWMTGKLQDIVNYNQYDAFTTYLLWLRTAAFAGFFSPAEYIVEQTRVEEYLEQLISNGSDHLQLFLDEWRRLRAIRNSG